MSSENSKDPVSNPPQYADEVLCANWNPLALLLAEPLAHAQKSALDGIDVKLSRPPVSLPAGVTSATRRNFRTAHRIRRFDASRLFAGAY